MRNIGGGRSTGARRRLIGLGVVSAMLAGLFSALAPSAVADASCPVPPDVFPVHDLHPGMTAEGSTVVQGTTQTPFDVEILGVAPDGIAPGVDFILAQITGPQSFLDETGGIVAGMSGSPVYIGADLVGSTSYGFGFADQTIMGITPAQPMVDLFDYPDGTAPAAVRARADAVAAARTVRLTPALRSAAAHASGRSSAAEFPGVAKQLPVPLAVSGVDRRGLVRLQAFIRHRLHLPLSVYGTTASSGGIAAGPLTGGDSLAATISTGALTAGAIGTATVACGDMVVGFGHPFGWTGPTTLGMNAANVLKIIKDVSQTLGGFKFATIENLLGTVDQDRLTGIRGIDGVTPDFARAVSAVENLDIPGRTRDGESRVMAQEFVPIVAALTMLTEEDVAFDRIGDGSVHAGWTIRGLDPDGNPFKLRRDNRYYSGFDATNESIFELLFELFTLQSSRFGDASFTSVRTNSTVTQDQLTTSIHKVLTSSSLDPGLAVHKRLRVRPGDTIHIQVQLLNHGQTNPVTVTMAIQLPDNAKGSGELFFGSGGEAFGSRGATSFSDLISDLEGAPHHYDLVAELNLNGRGGIIEPPFPELRTGGHVIHRQVVKPRNRVVTGHRLVRVVVVQPRAPQG
jgi:hypothetical protein